MIHPKVPAGLAHISAPWRRGMNVALQYKAPVLCTYSSEASTKGRGIVCVLAAKHLNSLSHLQQADKTVGRSVRSMI